MCVCACVCVCVYVRVCVCVCLMRTSSVHQPTVTHTHFSFLILWFSYFFTNLCIAVDFILHRLNNETLNMSERDFSRAMNGELTDVDATLATRRRGESLRVLVKGLHLLKSLQQRQEKLRSDAVSLRREIQTWNQETANRWKNEQTRH